MLCIAVFWAWYRVQCWVFHAYRTVKILKGNYVLLRWNYSPSTARWLDAFDTWLLCKDTIYQTCNPCHCQETTSCAPVSSVIEGRQLQFDTWLEQIPSSQHRVVSAPLWPMPEKPQGCPHLADGIDAESANTGIHLVWRTVRPYTATHHWRQSSIGTPLKKTALTWISLQAVVFCI